MGLNITITGAKAGTGGLATSTFDVDKCIKELRSKAGNAGLVLARMIQAGWADVDAHILITTDDVIIVSGEDTFYVCQSMNKMGRI